MIRSIKHLARATAMTAVLASAGVQAAPVSFDIRASGWTIGSGYGGGSGQLEVDFDTSSSRRTFTLSAGQTSASFNFGEIDLDESTIDANETDNLSVTARFNFDAPMDANQSVTATGVAVIGPVNNDSAVDYSIDWTPLTVTLNSGISFIISLADMSFTSTGDKNQTYTIKLLTEANPTSGNNVPEPGSLALAGAALALLGASRRRRAR